VNAPPDYVIEAARVAAGKSPCAKSKRGVALFCPGRGAVSVIHAGFNGPPPGFACSGLMSCRDHCAKLCVHAEQRAIMDVLGSPRRWGPTPLSDLELVHVKIDDCNVVVPGGGPSCWQCSRIVVEVGLRGVWLYEARGDCGASYVCPSRTRIITMRTAVTSSQVSGGSTPRRTSTSRPSAHAASATAQNRSRA
jgi:deoxycytidylate deaminase